MKSLKVHSDRLNELILKNGKNNVSTSLFFHQNEGECFPVYGDYVCQCLQPSYGRHCERLPDICKNEQPCVYGGDCVVENTVEVSCDNCDAGRCCLWLK